MRLGFWNRLAIVATGLALLILPVAIQFSMANEMFETRQRLYTWCLESAKERADNAVGTGVAVYAADAKQCDENWKNDEGYTPFRWGTWFEFAGGTLVFAGLLYALLWLGVIVSRWVWRGRAVKAN